MKKLNIALFATHTFALPTLKLLMDSGHDLTVISTDVFSYENMHMEEMVKTNGISFLRFSKAEMKDKLANVLKESNPDLCIVFTLNYKIHKDLLGIPKFGFYNVHFSLLPQYRGAMPAFWQLKNGQKNGGWSIIELDEGLDTGAIVFQENVNVIPGEICGSYTARLSYAVLPGIVKLIELCSRAEKPHAIPQVEALHSYYPIAQFDDLKINWETDTASTIFHLVNACNPDRGGAVTTLDGKELRVLEVSIADFQLNEPKVPGEVIYTDPSYGVFVYCSGHTFLRMNTLKMVEGYISGFKLIELGVRPGIRFETLVNR
ncbi:Methionyl-tRNA formyltransferase [compost metagenome]